nr:hypothetical protein [Actinopolyspora biskrensis]
MDSEVTIPEVAEAHAAALELRIRTLRLHRAVLRKVAGRGSTAPEEIRLVHKLAQLSADERRALINDFIDDTFGDLDLGPDFLPMMRGAVPELPEEPTQQQTEAWVELAELVQDPEFRDGLRRAATAQARAAAEVGRPSTDSNQSLATLLRQRVDAATEAGTEPRSPAARPVVDELVAAYARHTGQSDGPAFRPWLLELLESSGDRRYERYWRLLAVINGRPVPEEVAPAAEWLVAALRNG